MDEVYRLPALVGPERSEARLSWPRVARRLVAGRELRFNGAAMSGADQSVNAKVGQIHLFAG